MENSEAPPPPPPIPVVVNDEGLKSLPQPPPTDGGNLTKESNAEDGTEGAAPAEPFLEEEEEEEVISQNTTCLKTLTDGHHALEAKLNEAMSELAMKERIYKDVEEDVTHRKEKIRLLRERVQSQAEKLFCLKTSVEQKEKRQESVFAEISDVKWKIHEAKKLQAQLKTDHKDMKMKMEQRKEEFERAEDPEGKLAKKRKELQERNRKLEGYKKRLKDGDPELKSIENGNKMLELEQRKRALREAIDTRELGREGMYVEIDEKTEQLEKYKKSLANAKDYYANEIRQLKNKLGLARETELRLQRSFDYLQQKIDYGMHVPAPPPWPNTQRRI